MLRVAIAFIVPLAIDFVLLSLIFLFGANDLVGDSLTPVGVVIKVVISVTVIALNLGLAWLLVTRLDRRPLSDLRLRFDRRALIWFLAMIATALLMAVIMEVVLGFLGYEPSTENYSSVPVSAVILYVIDRIRAAFLQQGFPRNWCGEAGSSHRWAVRERPASSPSSSSRSCTSVRAAASRTGSTTSSTWPGLSDSPSLRWSPYGRRARPGRPLACTSART